MALFRSVTKNIKAPSAEKVTAFLRLSENGFFQVLKKVNVITCEKGNCLAEMKIDKDHSNTFNSLHGGLSATLIDAVSSFALLSYEKNIMAPSVTLDLHMTFLKAALIGDEIVIDAKTEKAGKTIAYLKCEIRNKATGDLLVKGSHTKCFTELKE